MGKPWETRETHMPDRLSASNINARVPYLFTSVPVTAGFIISPEAFASSSLCSYSADSANSWVKCTGKEKECVPGCIGTIILPLSGKNKSISHRHDWCRPNSTRCRGPFPHSELERMMKHQEARVHKRSIEKANGTEC